ncbi:hypothetical protein [Serratia marcescens]|uniref:hypothetical protein n=1 Tax=Serratia marcescens TaxID=615 RepID=UPI0015E88A64|nr:hypothetical protein [Serratia marcescens]
MLVFWLDILGTAVVARRKISDCFALNTGLKNQAKICDFGQSRKTRNGEKLA